MRVHGNIELTVFTTLKRSFVKEFLLIQVLHTLNQMGLQHHSRIHQTHHDLSATMQYTILWYQHSTYVILVVHQLLPSIVWRKLNLIEFWRVFDILSIFWIKYTYTRSAWLLCKSRIREYSVGHIHAFSIGWRFRSWPSPSICITIVWCELC